MYKLFLHPTERKSPPLLDDYFMKHPTISKEFNIGDSQYHHLAFSTDLSNPDLLVRDCLNIEGQNYDAWNDHCAFEFKFGMDLVNSLNSGLLKDELTRMRRKYTDRYYDNNTVVTYPKSSIPLYLVIVNEYDNLSSLTKAQKGKVISHEDLMWAVGIALDLNIRPIYCSRADLFAKKVFYLIRTPPSEVDLGQRFVIKSSGSVFSRQLQIEPGITRHIADKIEQIYQGWDEIIPYDKILLEGYLKDCFTTESGRFMKANMEKFLKKVSGGDGK